MDKAGYISIVVHYIIHIYSSTDIFKEQYLECVYRCDSRTVLPICETCNFLEKYEKCNMRIYLSDSSLMQ